MPLLKALLLNITTNTNKNVRVSGTHLVPLPGGQFKFAKELYRGDSIITLNPDSGVQNIETIQSILIEPAKGAYLKRKTKIGSNKFK